ncbi:MAG: hypothetical protein ABW166_09745 [Sedimenticola sp.]
MMNTAWIRLPFFYDTFDFRIIEHGCLYRPNNLLILLALQTHPNLTDEEQALCRLLGENRLGAHIRLVQSDNHLH